jgi:hypothetical protein
MRPVSKTARRPAPTRADSATSRGPRSDGDHLRRAAILELQRVGGNTAVARLLAPAAVSAAPGVLPPSPCLGEARTGRHQRAGGYRPELRHRALLQRKPSDVGSFEQRFAGTPRTMAMAFDSAEQIKALWAELGLGQLPSAVFGLQAIAAHEGDAPYAGAELIAAKFGNRFEVKLLHKDWHQFLNEITWSSDEAPDPHLLIHKWEAAATATGSGFRIFDAMREAAAGAGMKQIVADAIGDPLSQHNPENGYYTWIRFGFNNQLPSTIDTLVKRLREVFTRLEELPELEEQLAVLRGRVPDEALEDLDRGKAGERHLALENRVKLGDRLAEAEEDERQYLGMWIDVEDRRRHEGPHTAALEWVASHLEELTDLHQLMLRAGDRDTRTRLAALWKAYGQTVTQAVFDLSEHSDSMRVLALYKLDRENR